MDPAWVVASTLAGAAGGAVVPSLLRRLPPGEPVVPFAAPPAPEELARRPRLRLLCVAVGAQAGLVLGWSLAAPWPLLLWWPLVPVGVLLGYVDARTRLLPRIVVLPATAYAVLVTAAVELTLGEPAALVRALVGLVVVRTALWLTWAVHSAGMGFGDVRLSALLGFVLAHLGVGPVVIGLYAAFLLFGLPGLLLALWRRDRRVLSTAYPFGPFLLAGALVGVAVGAPVWAGLTSG